MKNGKKNNFFIVLILLITAIIVLLYFYKKQQDAYLVVSFLNVGQGDAIFIEAPNGKQVLIDAGPDQDIVRELSKVMPFWDRAIDIVIPTHADKDHIGGFPEVFKRYEIDMVYDTQNTATTEIYQAFADGRDFEKAEIIEADASHTIVLDDKRNIYLRTLFPDRNITDLERNDTSTVLQLVYGDNEFMLTGDAGKMVEEYIVSLYTEDIQSDVLKAGHHGSKTSSSEKFIDIVHPEFVVISAGENNSYGHPHQEVISLFQKRDIKILETKNGMIQFFSDGVNIVIKQ